MGVIALATKVEKSLGNRGETINGHLFWSPGEISRWLEAEDWPLLMDMQGCL